MRQIKFRAKRIDNGEWVEGHYYQGEVNGFIQTPVFHHPVDESTLGQFIGRYDRDGVEVFEGDIVENNGISWIVDWIDGCVYIRQIGKDNNKWWIGGEAEHSKVIGNVTDNKELLS